MIGIRTRLAIGVAIHVALTGCGVGSADRSASPRAQDELPRRGTPVGKDGIVLTARLPVAVRTACHNAAKQSSIHPVCPPLVPIGSRGKAYSNDDGTYVLDLHSDQLAREDGGHWTFTANPPWWLRQLVRRNVADGHRVRVRRVDIGGVSARTFRMPSATGGLYGNHIVLVWRSRGTEHHLSAHGSGMLPRLRTMARAIVHSEAELDTVVGVRFVAAGPKVERQCRRTARAIRHPVVCPGFVPDLSSATAFNCRAQGRARDVVGTGCLAFHRWQVTSVEYVGPGAEGHVVIQAAPGRVSYRDFVMGPGVDGDVRLRLGPSRRLGQWRGRDVEVVSAPGSALDGHTIFFWRAHGNTYGVGFHESPSTARALNDYVVRNSQLVR